MPVRLNSPKRESLPTWHTRTSKKLPNLIAHTVAMTVVTHDLKFNLDRPRVCACSTVAQAISVTYVIVPVMSKNFSLSNGKPCTKNTTQFTPNETAANSGIFKA